MGQLLTMKDIAKILDKVARNCASSIRGLTQDAGMASWKRLHGWEDLGEHATILVARQAALNAFVRKCFPGATFFNTPLDGCITASQLPKELVLPPESAKAFNWWGNLYSLLIPQTQRREIGQFWTSQPIADWMTGWLLHFRPKTMVDLGCGPGSFMLAATQTLKGRKSKTLLRGYDISPLMLNLTTANFLSRSLPPPILSETNYLDAPLLSQAEAVVCNPPYTRHHRVPSEVKNALQDYFRTHLRIKISRLATLAFHFLLKMISEMPEGCRAAFIVPMQVIDARYGLATKLALCRHTVIHAVVHFSQEMNAFANVDVGASIILFQKGWKAKNLVKHVTLRAMPKTTELLKLLGSPDPQETEFGVLDVREQDDLTNMPKWFSMTCRSEKVHTLEESGKVVRLGELAHIMRGIATGANEFFALTSDDVRKYHLQNFVVKTLQRNREVQDILFDKKDWLRLCEEGKRVWLLYLNGKENQEVPVLRDYIRFGEESGFHRRSLVNTRKRWYMMEQREVPPIFFTILTRGNPRFILNRAGVRPLNMFLLIYPKNELVSNGFVQMLWALLNSDFSISRLHSVSRTYGGNSLKVEPRELDNLPVINPLAIGDATRKDIEDAIRNFFRLRDIKAFRKRMDELVAEMLTSDAHWGRKRRILKQLTLCEGEAPYRKRRRS